MGYSVFKINSKWSEVMGSFIVKILRKKHRYYGHRSGGYVKDYFGHEGEKIEVGVIVFWLLKLTGYKTTKETI